MTQRKQHIASIEDLARVTQEGFLSVEQRMRDGFTILGDAIDLVRQDVHDIRVTLGPLVSHVAATERRVNELTKRLERVERKVGIAS